MALAIYLLCALSALTCCVLLLRGYWRSRSRFLFWSGLCFGLLTLDNAMLFVDRVFFPDIDLSSHWRAPITLLALVLLLYGMIFEVR